MVQKIAQLPLIGTPTLDDLVVIEQTVGTFAITYKGTVRQLLGITIPVPTITNVIWSDQTQTLQVKGQNLLPTTLITIDDKPYLMQNYQAYEEEVSIQFNLEEGLTGVHQVKAKNFIHEVSYNFTV